MIVKVKARAQRRGDRAGNPLDGLVNMFDLGIVLAVACFVAVLQAHGLTHVLTQKRARPQRSSRPHPSRLRSNPPPPKSTSKVAPPSARSTSSLMAHSSTSRAGRAPGGHGGENTN